MAINLFLLSTTSQLINVIEAKNHFNISNDSSVAILNPYANNLQQIKKIINVSEWKEIYFIDDDVESQMRHEENLKSKRFIPAFKKVFENSGKLKELIGKFPVVDNLFVGYYLSLENLHFMNSVKYKRIILLDDGIATLEINDRRKNKTSFLSAWSIPFLARVLFKKFVLQYRIRHPKTVTFFSAYHIEPDISDFLEVNNYNEVKRLAGKKEASEEVFLLGQGLSEFKPMIISEEVYFDYINKVIQQFRPGKVIYIPHRDEDRPKIERLVAALGIEIRFLDMPIELYLVRQPKLPKYCIGFITSALPNCKKIFDSNLNIYAVRLDSKKIINKPWRKIIDNTYTYFETLTDENFSIISY